jgi:hypothetical protein
VEEGKVIRWIRTRLRYPYVMMHVYGCHDEDGDHYACGKPAFLLRRLPISGDLALSSSAAHLNGTPMELYERTTCDSCGGYLRLRSLDVRKREWIPRW